MLLMKDEKYLKEPFTGWSKKLVKVSIQHGHPSAISMFEMKMSNLELSLMKDVLL